MPIALAADVSAMSFGLAGTSFGVRTDLLNMCAKRRSVAWILVVIDGDALAEVVEAAETVAETEGEIDRLIGEGELLERAFVDAEMA